MPKRPRPSSARAARNADPLAAFLAAHHLEIAIEEVLHVTPIPEESDAIRQHHHVTLRANGRAFVLCVTALNWDDATPDPTLVLHTLATEAAVFESAEGSFLRWAVALDWDPDSRAVERRFRQAAELVRALRALLGDTAYDELLALADTMVEKLLGQDDSER